MSNDKTESISDKLRSWADESEDERPAHGYPSIVARSELGMVYGTPRDEERKLFHHIADEIDREKREITERYARQSWMNPADAIAKLATGEIEWAELHQALDRYYLPRPLFEDGEPVSWGQDYQSDTGRSAMLMQFSVSNRGRYVLGKKGRRTVIEPGERVKRPERPVLDADCAPIKVGDVLYRTTDGMKVTVARLGKWYFVDEEGCALTPSYFTHREPDTQERIDGDATIAPGWYCAKYGIELSSGADFAETYIKMTKHLLRRQRELDNREKR